MRRAIGMLLLAAVAATVCTPARAASPDGFRWRERVLLVFGAGAEAERQVNWLLEQPEELTERKIALISIDGDPHILHGPDDVALPGADALRHAVDGSLGDGFEAVLIGLDGGVKWRSSQVTAPDRIFAVIDAMPMRRSDR